MKLRHVFLADRIETARLAVADLRQMGVPDSDLSLIAGSDIVMEQVPENLKDDSATDFVPAAVRGALGGGGIGLLAGLVGAAIPPLGITVAGAAFLGVIGAAVGTWSTALMGAAIPNEVHRKFEERIRAGEVLVVLDAEQEKLPALEAVLQRHGARRIEYEVPAALT